jgi:branched-chain amino acid transport system ATP-binding protein
MTPLLTVSNVSAGYGQLIALRGVSLHVDSGEIVSIVGANGAGKSTLLLSIARHLPLREGRIVFDQEDIGALHAHELPARGLAMIPEGGRLFPFMTVQENIELGAYHERARRRMRTSIDEAAELFPILRTHAKRLAGRLSGGERQMVAMARGMMSLPKLLMFDEPSLGLSPLMVGKMFEIVRLLASRGITVLLVEQNVADSLAISDRGYLMENGCIVRSGSGSELLRDESIQRAYMGM